MRIKIGDVVEIKTSKGLAYALYTHRHQTPPRFGAMLRVFDELFAARPVDIETIVQLPVRFTTFFPLQAAVDRGIVEIVGNARVPDHLCAFPIFRTGMINPQTKQVEQWSLWDGEKSWRVGLLSPEQRSLPIRGICNDTLLIDRIEKGWRPENDSR